MSEMVERVARAIYETWARNRSVTEPWDEVRRLGHSIAEEAMSEARAAIEAMREPTDEQRNAYYELSHRTETMSDAHWERAIDAILSTDPNTEVQK